MLVIIAMLVIIKEVIDIFHMYQVGFSFGGDITCALTFYFSCSLKIIKN